jgi:hypothetical protein
MRCKTPVRFLGGGGLAIASRYPTHGIGPPFLQFALTISHPAMAQSSYDTKNHLYPAQRQTAHDMVLHPFEVTAMPTTPAN